MRHKIIHPFLIVPAAQSIGLSHSPLYGTSAPGVQARHGCLARVYPRSFLASCVSHQKPLEHRAYMRIGIVSDIHADAPALRRALEDMPSTDMLLCPGDAISEYRFCADTVELLRRAGVVCIQGNHELVLFGGRNPAYLQKCRDTFAAESLDFLAQAPLRREIECDGATILMVHASPWEPHDEYIYRR